MWAQCPTQCPCADQFGTHVYIVIKMRHSISCASKNSLKECVESLLVLFSSGIMY